MISADAPLRLGYSENVSERKKSENRSFDKYLTIIVVDDPERHEVEHNMNLVSILGGKVGDNKLELWLSPEDREFAKSTLLSWRVDEFQPIVACCPGASHRTKMWPVQNFVSLCTWLIDQYHVRIRPVGGKDDSELVLQFPAPKAGGIFEYDRTDNN